MPSSVNVRLSIMMFLNYVIWGSWYVTIGTYLTATLKFTGTETGAIFGTSALAAMISPFFIGMIADRFFATERVLAFLHLIGALLLFLVTRVTGFGAVYALMLGYCLCFFPTIALTNSLALRPMSDCEELNGVGVPVFQAAIRNAVSIETPALADCCDGIRRCPASFFQSIERWIQRALFNAQRIVGRLLNPASDAKSVRGLKLQRAKNEHVEGAAQQVEWFAGNMRLHRSSMGRIYGAP